MTVKKWYANAVRSLIIQICLEWFYVVIINRAYFHTHNILRGKSIHFCCCCCWCLWRVSTLPIGGLSCMRYFFCPTWNMPKHPNSRIIIWYSQYWRVHKKNSANSRRTKRHETLVNSIVQNTRKQQLAQNGKLNIMILMAFVTNSCTGHCKWQNNMWSGSCLESAKEQEIGGGRKEGRQSRRDRRRCLLCKQTNGCCLCCTFDLLAPIWPMLALCTLRFRVFCVNSKHISNATDLNFMLGRCNTIFLCSISSLPWIFSCRKSQAT